MAQGWDGVRDSARTAPSSICAASFAQPASTSAHPRVAPNEIGVGHGAAPRPQAEHVRGDLGGDGVAVVAARWACPSAPGEHGAGPDDQPQPRQRIAAPLHLKSVPEGSAAWQRRTARHRGGSGSTAANDSARLREPGAEIDPRRPVGHSWVTTGSRRGAEGWTGGRHGCCGHWSSRRRTATTRRSPPSPGWSATAAWPSPTGSCATWGGLRMPSSTDAAHRVEGAAAAPRSGALRRLAAQDPGPRLLRGGPPGEGWWRHEVTFLPTSTEPGRAGRPAHGRSSCPRPAGARVPPALPGAAGGVRLPPRAGTGPRGRSPTSWASRWVRSSRAFTTPPPRSCGPPWRQTPAAGPRRSDPHDHHARSRSPVRGLDGRGARDAARRRPGRRLRGDPPGPHSTAACAAGGRGCPGLPEPWR